MWNFRQHSTEHLHKFIATASDGFNDAYDSLTSSHKEKYKTFLLYLERVLEHYLENHNGFNYLNLHINGIDEELQDTFTEFLIMLLFNKSIKGPNETEAIEKKIFELERTLTFRYKETPSYVSGKRLNRKTNLWKQGKANLLRLIKFYKKVFSKHGKHASMESRTIISLQNKKHETMRRIFESSPYAMSIEKGSFETSCVLLNSTLYLSDIDGITLPDDSYLFDKIENIFVVGCEGKRISRSFNYNELKRLNQHGRLKNLIVISFSDKAEGFSRTKSKLEKIQGLYHSIPKYPDYLSYLISEDEINIVLDRETFNENIINFYGEHYSSFWEEFKTLLNRYEGLYELRSIKMMNIYSLAMTEEICDMILAEIFEHSSDSDLLIEDTRACLKDLSGETTMELRTTLRNVLKFIASSDWLAYITSQISLNSTLIVSHAFKNNQKLATALRRVLKLTAKHQIHSWLTVDLGLKNTNFVILDYRDVGRFPYSISPNILELPSETRSNAVCHFLGFFFKLKFDWTSYNYKNDSCKLLSNDLRVQHFEFDELARQIKSQRPVNEDVVIWDIEQQLEPGRSLPSFKIKFEDGSRRSYPPSDLLIVGFGNTSNLVVRRAGDVLEEDSDENVYIQALDEIHSEFNIYEKIANKDRENRELQSIKANYGLNKNERAERLWKILLNRKGNDKTLEDLYIDVQSFLRERGSHLVSISTFKDHWLNLESTTLIPREKRSFFRLCEYLGLPRSYFDIMVRLKNVEVQNSRNNNIQMNSLLSDLINGGCFNERAAVTQLLNSMVNKIKRNHDLHEIGFYTETLVEDLAALVELLKPYTNLKQIREIESNQHD